MSAEAATRGPACRIRAPAPLRLCDLFDKMSCSFRSFHFLVPHHARERTGAGHRPGVPGRPYPDVGPAPAGADAGRGRRRAVRYAAVPWASGSGWNRSKRSRPVYMSQ
ncbi:hypothetical protein GCM10009551_019800 [Nocardiopsis tropica]